MNLKFNNLFKKLPVQLSSIEQFDERIQLTHRRDWLPVTILALLLILFLAWSFLGRIPIHVMGQGILVRPRKVIDFQSPVMGQLEELKVEIGDCIAKKQVLATIDPSDIRLKLGQERTKLKELQLESQKASLLQIQHTDLEKATIQQQQASIKENLQTTQSLTPVLKKQGKDLIKQQRASLEQQLKDTQAMIPILKVQAIQAFQKKRNSLQQQLHDSRYLTDVFQQRQNRQSSLLKEGAISKDQFLQNEQEYLQSRQKISELEAALRDLDVQETQAQQQYLKNISTISEYQAQLRDLDLKETEAQEKYLKNLNTIVELKAQMRELETKEKKLAQENLEASNTRKNQINEVQRNIAQLQKQYDNNKQIKSPQAGCILELTVNPGSIINPGTRIGSINVKDSFNRLVSVIYLSVGDGKKIQPGMKVQITPDTVKRERFGGLIGTVTKVSAFPVTKEGAANLVGNREIVEGLSRQLAKEGAVMEIQADLQVDSSTFSGYKWSSSTGPNLKISPGTTTNVRILVEERRPITFVFPILREWSGIF